jgi:hypothetical protein
MRVMPINPWYHLLLDNKGEPCKLYVRGDENKHYQGFIDQVAQGYVVLSDDEPGLIYLGLDSIESVMFGTETLAKEKETRKIKQLEKAFTDETNLD